MVLLNLAGAVMCLRGSAGMLRWGSEEVGKVVSQW